MFWDAVSVSEIFKSTPIQWMWMKFCLWYSQHWQIAFKITHMNIFSSSYLSLPSKMYMTIQKWFKWAFSDLPPLWLRFAYVKANKITWLRLGEDCGPGWKKCWLMVGDGTQTTVPCVKVWCVKQHHATSAFVITSKASRGVNTTCYGQWNK